ncbi:MFS transporter [Infirmifilum uzonense]|uniref:MFS transporter n=1 Tax=Infirmifilum uzonense TaxID=1550241 RepID=UPI00069A8A10|nr:MFS transporter [Infirmifilum uzonense]
MSARRVLILLMLGWGLGAMCAGIVSGTLSLIKSDLHLTGEETGRVLSSWSLGMLVGASLYGYFADRFGRRISILVSTVGLGVFTSLSYIARGWLDLSFYRILAGASNAGYMVVASTMMSEFAPTYSRGRLVAILESSWALGWLLALFLARIIAPMYGWRPVFLTAFSSILLAMILYPTLPESPRYLKLRKELNSSSSVVEGAKNSMKSKGLASVSVWELLRPPYLRRTIMLWTHWFAIALTYWGIFLWLPDMLNARGLGYAKSLEFSIIITLAQIPGYLSAAYLIEKAGRKPTLASYMLLGGLASIGVFMASAQLDLFIWGSLVSFFNLGAWGVTYAYTPELYPTRLRGTGSGWANSFGRIGGIIGPYAAGVLMQTFKDPLTPFSLFALMHIVSAFTVFTLGVETKGKPLEEVSP